MRIHQYVVLLEDVLKRTSDETTEVADLTLTVKLMRAFEYELATLLNVGESEQRWLGVEDLTGRLINRTGIDLSEVNFEDKDRRLFHRGILERQEQDWRVVYAVLLDNCLILTTPVLPVHRLPISEWKPYETGLELNNSVSLRLWQILVTGYC